MNEDESKHRKKLARRAEEAAQRARDRARLAKWDMNVVIFLFAILALVMILLFQGFPTEVVAPIAFAGFAFCWLVGWRREKKLYERFYREEWEREKETYELLHGKSLSE